MRKNLVVFRCKNCIDDLKEYNPYVDKNGKTIPLSMIEIIEVDKEFCENYEGNLNAKPQFQAPIDISNYPEKPWKVVVWNSIYDREEGISEIYGRFTSFAGAKYEIESDGTAKYCACYEIQLDNGDESRAIYIYANTKPLADEFIKISKKEI